MKKIKYHILALALIMMTGLTSCFDERDDDYKIIGAVASIPTLTFSKTNPIVGENITLSFRYYSENAVVNELRLSETIGTGTAAVVQTKTISGFDTRNSYNDSFTYTVPSVPIGTRITLAVQVVTENTLTNSRSGNITVN